MFHLLPRINSKALASGAGSAALFAAILIPCLIFPRPAPAVEVGEDGGRALTIKDAILTAFINNKPIQIQEQEIKFARADIMYAKSRFLPQVGMSYSYTLNDATPGQGTLVGGARKDAGIFYGYKNDNLFSLYATETIYNGGANIAQLQQAKVQLKIQEETLRATKLDVEFETKRLFYGLLLGYETLRIAEDLVDQARAHYDEVNAMYSQGMSSKFDVLQSKTQVAVLIPQLVNAQNAITLITAELKKELGVNMKDPVRISGELEFEEIEIKEDDFLTEAYSHNPQMILKLLGVDLKKWSIELAKAGWLPQVNAYAGYTYESNNVDDMFNPRHNLWNVGVQASIAIFDGFATKALVDAAKARYAQAALQKENIRDQLVVDIRSACVDLKQAKAIIESQRSSIVEAEESLRLSKVRFENGVGINLDVFDAEVALAQVQQSLAQGTYDYIMARAQLDRTTGRQYQGGN
jgi:outer membrane protein TolC